MSTDSTSKTPITLKWGKNVYTRKIFFSSETKAYDLKHQVEELTNVPITRQKLLCPKVWKGALNDKHILPENIKQCLPKGKDSLPVTLIGSAEVLIEKPVEERPRFVEDLTPEERHNLEFSNATETTESKLSATHQQTGDIVALQRTPGQDRNDNKMEMYQYNRFVKGLPQRQIEDNLRKRKESTNPGALLGEVAMTMGVELRRSYVNSLAVLKDGTLVCALDDGHVQMWRRGELVKDMVHDGNSNAGVDQVITLPPMSADGPSFATGGRGNIKVWSDDGVCLLSLPSFPGTSPLSFGTGIIPDSDVKFLASAFKITRPNNPNQFRLVPQDEAGRRRRAAAEEEERVMRQSLLRTSQCISFWLYDGEGQTSGVSFSGGIIPPATGTSNSPTVTKLAVSGGALVCGDAWGGIRVIRWSPEQDGHRPRQSSSLQFRCGVNDCITIACMESLEDNLLAVSTDVLPNHNEEVRLLPSATELRITCPRAVFIFDLDCLAIKLVLDGHSDAVQCICPLPNGDILTCGGKMDATIRVWETLPLTNTSVNDTSVNDSKEEEEDYVPILTKAEQLKEPGYVFDLKVLPDADPESRIYAVAGARYNVVKIVI